MFALLLVLSVLAAIIGMFYLSQATMGSASWCWRFYLPSSPASPRRTNIIRKRMGGHHLKAEVEPGPVWGHHRYKLKRPLFGGQRPLLLFTKLWSTAKKGQGFCLWYYWKP